MKASPPSGTRGIGIRPLHERSRCCENTPVCGPPCVPKHGLGAEMTIECSCVDVRDTGHQDARGQHTLRRRKTASKDNHFGTPKTLECGRGEMKFGSENCFRGRNPELDQMGQDPCMFWSPCGWTVRGHAQSKGVAETAKPKLVFMMPGKC